MERLEICLLGSPRIELDGDTVEFDTRKAIALLAYLALTGERASRDTLAALLWPDYDQTRARAALRRTLSTLNQALSGGDESWLEIDRESVRFKPDSAYTLDIHRFRKAVAACRSHAHSSAEVCPDCAASLTDAAAIYRDDFLSGFTLRDSPAFDDWQFFQTENLRQELEGVLEKLTCLHSSQGDFESAIATARRWLALDTLNETAQRQLMLLYAWAGQRSAALRQYHECARILEQELGVAPLEETTRLYQSILENRLPPTPTLAGAGPTPTSKEEPVSPPEPKQTDRGFPLVGRSQEWQVLLQAYEKVGRDGYFFILNGEAGIGKTRLAEEFLAYVKAEGAAVIKTLCYEGETSLAYGPLIDGLRTALARADFDRRLKAIPAHWVHEAARLLPGLEAQAADAPQGMVMEGLGAQSRFFEGLRQVLAGLCQGSASGVILLDDAHWADAATLDLLTYLGRRLRGFPCLLLITRRLDGAPSNNRLDRLIASVQREGLGNQITLPRLDYTDVEKLALSIASNVEPLPAELIQRLNTEAEGLPFFVVEYLSTILEELQSGSPLDWSIPRGVRDLLHSRLSAVSETGWQLLTTAAVIGRSFDLDTLQQTSGRGETETLEGLEELTAQGLIQEHSLHKGRPDAETPGNGGLSFDFSHEKIRAVIYEETSQARRRLLHRRVADTLVDQARSHFGAESLASQIAPHYRAAGRDELAAGYYRTAGDYARSLFANTEALSHYRSALESGHPDAPHIHEAIGDLLTLQGEYGAALASYEKAASFNDPGSTGILAQKLGIVHHRRGEWEQAESYFQSALDSLGEKGEPAQLARLYADWSLTAYNRGQPERCEVLVGQALQLAGAAGDLYAQAQAHNILGILARAAGEYDRAKAQLEQSLEFAEKLGDAYIRSAAFNNLALVYAAQGDLEQAVALAKSALKVCIRMGDRHREAAIHNNLADFYHAAGQSDQAMAELKNAVVIFAEIGLEAGRLSSEIWKLREW